MFADELKDYVLNNPKLVKMKCIGDGKYLLKYTRKVFYESLWNPFLEECRGSIVDENFNLITYPFTKIYNYGIEKNSPVFNDSDIVIAHRKINGFMVAITYYNNDILISTTGSIDSDYTAMAKEMMQKHMSLCEWKHILSQYKMTFMFECVHPNDPHIIPEKCGMYLLACRENTFHSVIIHDKNYEYGTIFKCFVPEAIELSVKELKNLVKTCKHEGFVFYHSDGIRAAKIKSPYYLITKFVARMRDTDRLMKPGIKQRIDEEYYPLIDFIQANIETFTAMGEQERLTYIRNFLENSDISV